ncbi:MAG: 2Fe-2S iron-sulfur cluster-binding protein [Bacteroidetes bacterium]|nr:2Fe-2S iron-sulfur cluster-binding protein [Bacteroidota bacterium]
MVTLTIDHKPVVVKEGISVMEAAAILGIAIPSMCFKPGFSNHPSCMVCLVKDLDHAHLVPSCALPVSDGMRIITDSDEVKEARREAIELLLSDHLGDCEAPCRLSCPASMDIPLMNRLIAKGEFQHALHIVRQEIAIPWILGYICPAPCEKACKRKPMDQAVSICLLKRSVAQLGEQPNHRAVDIARSNGKKIAIIGAGPAGLSAAFHLLRSGHACILFDQHEKAGGSMRYDIPEGRLPGEILDAEVDIIRQMGAEFRLGVMVTREFFQQTIRPEFDAVIVATGNLKTNSADFFGIQADENGGFDSGVFACGNIIREQRLAVHSTAQGKMAANQVEIYLGTNRSTNQNNKHHRRSVSATGHLQEPEWKEYLQESSSGKRVEPLGGILAGFSREEAMHEAKRCLHCDCRKPVSCKLRMYAEEYGAKRKRFAGPERKSITKSWQHELVVYEKEKCIRCGLCVDITRKKGESIGLTFAGRGFDVSISVPFNETMKEALTKTAGECVEACPTGALAFKNLEERNV